MTEQRPNDLRPLLPRRGFGLTSWFRNPWLSFFNRGYTNISNPNSGAETDSPVHQTSNAFNLNVVGTNVPPAPPNTPPETNHEREQSVEITIEHEELETNEQEHLLNATRQAESSTMGADRVRSIASSTTFQEANGQEMEATSIGGSSRRRCNERICLICLDPLTDEEFSTGAAISLACECKGEAAYRHKDCAQKWVNIKGDRICDICRTTITNLDPPPPGSEAGSNRHSDAQTDESRNRYPSPSDVFDCIRMTWVVTIVCVLFFNLDIASALVTGLLVAVMYTWLCQLIRCVHYQTTNLGVGSDQEQPIGIEQNRPIAAPEIVVQ